MTDDEIRDAAVAWVDENAGVIDGLPHDAVIGLDVDDMDAFVADRAEFLLAYRDDSIVEAVRSVLFGRCLLAFASADEDGVPGTVVIAFNVCAMNAKGGDA